jgi:H+/Cl- antiporter ClcA
MKIKYLRKIVRIKQNRWINLTHLYLKDLYDKTIETNSIIKNQILQFLPFLIASFLTGTVAFLYSRLFSYTEELSLYIFEINRSYIFFSAPICFLISWWLVKRFAPYARGSGIPQVMASIELAKPRSNYIIETFLGVKIIFIKVASSAVKVLGGGILGREGPTIQISSSIFYLVQKWVPKWWMPVSQKNILIAGAASGLAAAFNTPLGGIIFAIEELSKFHIKYSKSPLFIAVIIAGLTAQGFGGSYLYLAYPKIDFTGWNVALGLILVSVISGYFGSKMCVILLRFMNYFNSIKNRRNEIGLVLLSSFFVAACIYFFGAEAMGSGKEIMVRTLFTTSKTVEWYLPFIRMIGLVTSFGIGGAGGVFAPSLSAGACFGALIAQLLHFTGGNADALILIGMTAFLTGVTRAPFTSAIIIFEMTDRHSIIFFLLLSAIIANVIAYYVDRHPFYEQLKANYIQEVT